MMITRVKNWLEAGKTRMNDKQKKSNGQEKVLCDGRKNFENSLRALKSNEGYLGTNDPDRHANHAYTNIHVHLLTIFFE